ncbi:hypothetical protein BH11PLA1_BH11PLA1_09170 [soil metagenome]
MASGASQSRLKDALKELRMAWYTVKQEWDDSAATKFEEEFILPLEGRIAGAIGAMGRLMEVMDAARRECDKER